ncbi:MAG: hypothetical protein RLZZ292_3961 [Bacteroidota bacterium]|jgi:microcystin-dependent protein
MDENYLGEIRMFAGNFAPRGWAFCNGQFLTVEQNNSLFGIIGYTYGRKDNLFMLPDLRGRVPIHVDADKSITLGQKGGTDTSLLTADQLPEHTHNIYSVSSIKCTDSNGNTNNPSGSFPAKNGDLSYNDNKTERNSFFANDAFVIVSSPKVQPQAQPIENMMPYLGISYIIALQGTYPL